MPTHGDWTAPDTVWFSNRVVDKQFVSIIRDIGYDDDEGLVRIGVSLIDTTHPTEDIYVEKELEQSGRAAALCV